MFLVELVKKHYLCEQCESFLYVGGGCNNNWNFLLFFGTLALVVGVSLDVEINQLFYFFDLRCEGLSTAHHFFLSVCGLDLALLDCFLGFNDFVKCLLLVSQSFTFCCEENIVSCGVVKGEGLFLLLLVFLLVGRGAHYLNGVIKIILGTCPLLYFQSLKIV